MLQGFGSRPKDVIEFVGAWRGKPVPPSVAAAMATCESLFAGFFTLISNVTIAVSYTHLNPRHHTDLDYWRSLLAMPSLQGFSHAIYSLLAMGWRGGNRQWSNFEMAYLLLAGLSTPLVLSVHTIVSFDFAVSNVPGWHTTIFPPYFVAGAVYCGFAMVINLLTAATAGVGVPLLLRQHSGISMKVWTHPVTSLQVFAAELLGK